MANKKILTDLTIDGDVGIGTTSPGYKLEVDGTARITSALTFGGNVNNIINGTGSSLDFKSNGDYFFRKGANTNLTILSGGNVGIGTDSPSGLLHLLTTTTDETQQLLIQNGNSGDAAIKFNISGDTYSLGIDNSDSDKFKLSYGDLGTNDRIVIDSTGNVGIGTYRPNEKLQVGGNIHIWDREGGTDGALFVTQASTTTTTAKINSNGDSYFNGGNVGIGTDSPSHKLTVPSGTDGRVARFGNLEITTQAGTYSGSSIEVTGANSFIKYNSTLGHKFFTRVQDGGNTLEALTILPDTGNVGIGTDSPESKLTIRGDATNTSQPVRITNSVTDTHTGLFLNNTGGTIGEKYGMQFGGYENYSLGGIFGVLDSTAGSTSGDITFDLANGTASGAMVERVRITHEGNVGIGTDSPLAKLNIESPLGSDIAFRLTQTSKNWWEFKNTGNANDLSLSDAFGTYATFKTGGNVGIGTTSPSAKLHIYQTGSGTVNSIITEDSARKIFIGRDSIKATDLSDNAATLHLQQNGGSATFGSDVTADSFIKDGGTSAQFLKADGSVDSTTYLASLDGYSESGTNAGGDLVVKIGDHSDVYTGAKLTIDIDNEEASMSGGGFVAGSFNLESSSNRGTIATQTLTSSRTWQFPNTSGTIALTSNIPTDFVSQANGGTFDSDVSFDSNATIYGDLIVDGGKIDMSSGDTIVNVPNPTAAQDVATKNYVDTNIPTDFVSRTNGGTFEDNVTFEGDVKLHEGSKVIFDNDGDSFANIFYDVDGTGKMIYNSVDEHHFKNGDDGQYDNVKANSFIKDGGTSAQFLKADGSVDTNTYLKDTTDTFTGDLTVTGTITAPKFFISQANLATAWALQARNSSSTADSGLYFSSDSAELLLRNTSNSLTTRIRSNDVSYFNGGNVGIGTTNPSQKLEVDGNIIANEDVFCDNVGVGSTDVASNFGSLAVVKLKSTGNNELILDHTDGGAGSDLGLLSFERNGDHLAHIRAAHQTAADDALISFHTQSTGGTFSNAASNERMRIDSIGRVGIGETSPEAQLHVNRAESSYAVNIDNTHTRASLKLISSTNNDSQLTFSQGGSGVQYIQAMNQAGTTGKDINLNPYGGNVISAGTFTGTNFILSSDSRLKENVEKVDNKSINVDWKTFEMKSNKGQKRYGVIAQELEEVHPEFVRTNDEGMKSVAYVDLLIAKIAELEARLAKLEK